MRLVCPACGAEIDASGVFPGATLACACGGQAVVPALPTPSSRGGGRPFTSPLGVASQGPYRSAAARMEAPAPKKAVARAAPDELRARCPRCPASGLDETMVEGHSVLRCEKCAGVFVPMEDVAQMVKAAQSGDPRASVPPRPLERDIRYMRCVHCVETMSRLNFGGRSGVVVDVCRVHGTWFDGGELEAALAWVQRAPSLPHFPIAPPRSPRGETVEHATAVLEVSLMEDSARDARIANVAASASRGGLFAGPSLVDLLVDYFM